MKSVLVTGSSGFLGHYIINYLISLDIICYIFARDRSTIYPDQPNIIPIYSLDPVDFETNYSSIDAVLHVGSPSAQNCSDIAIEQCILQAKELINFISVLRIPKLLFFSTVHVYGDIHHDIINENLYPSPVSSYGRLKFNLEQLFGEESAKHAFHFTALRLSNVIGAPYRGFSNWHLVFPSFIRSCLLNQSIVINSNPLLSRDFITIEFLLFYLSKILISTPNQFSVLNITSAHAVTLLELASSIRNRYCFLTGKAPSSVKIICSTQQSNSPPIVYDNSRLRGLYGVVSNNIISQIDQAFQYLIDS